MAFKKNYIILCIIYMPVKILIIPTIDKKVFHKDKKKKGNIIFTREGTKFSICLFLIFMVYPSG